MSVADADVVARDRLAPWVRAHVDGASDDVTVDQLSGGSSNLTFRVRSGIRDLVLRRPPAGRVLATANDVLREHRVQAALAGSGVPVAPMVAACDDVDVIGAPFYLMEHLHGIVYADADAVAHLNEADARGASEELVDVLARLHAVDAEACGLGDLGKPDGFVARQVDRWCTQWNASKQREVAAVDEVARRLRRAVPAHSRAGIVHGDYSFNNTMWHRDEPARMQAVLDWEMATLGDPLTDLGMLVTYWGPVGELLWRARVPQAHRANAGFPDAGALVERYARTTGLDADAIDFYRVLATFKLAVISEGAHARLVASGATPERARHAGETVEALAAAALDLADRSPSAVLRGAST